MKTFKNYLLTGGLLCVALALPCRSAAAPGQTSHFKFAGLTASAFFDSFDPTGCVETLASVFAISDRTQTMGRPEATPTAFVSLFQADNCTFTLLVSAFGSADLSAATFQIKQNLDSATLNTSIDVFDFVSGTTFPVDISLIWTGTGGLTVSKFHNITRMPGLQENSTFTGTSRPATASGSMTSLWTNFAPNPAVFPAAELDSVKTGDVTITHPSH